MTASKTTSILASLRSIVPQRVITFNEALRIAELQARRLADLIGDPSGISEHHIAGMPRMAVTYENLPVSGMSYWNGQLWVIVIAATDSLARQRFTLLHEFKHIVDHPAKARLYTDNRRMSASDQSEAAADYFAGCALVGRRELKSAWGNRIQKAEDLAAHFGVSVSAIRVRLAQTGLNAISDRLPAARCARPISTASSHGQRFRAVRPAYTQRSYA